MSAGYLPKKKSYEPMEDGGSILYNSISYHAGGSIWLNICPSKFFLAQSSVFSQKKRKPSSVS